MRRSRTACCVCGGVTPTPAQHAQSQPTGWVVDVNGTPAQGNALFYARRCACSQQTAPTAAGENARQMSAQNNVAVEQTGIQQCMRTTFFCSCAADAARRKVKWEASNGNKTTPPRAQAPSAAHAYACNGHVQSTAYANMPPSCRSP